MASWFFDHYNLRNSPTVFASVTCTRSGCTWAAAHTAETMGETRVFLLGCYAAHVDEQHTPQPAPRRSLGDRLHDWMARYAR